MESVLFQPTSVLQFELIRYLYLIICLLCHANTIIHFLCSLVFSLYAELRIHVNTHTCQPYRDFSDLAVLYRELLHLYRDLSLEKINDCESNNV